MKTIDPSQNRLLDLYPDVESVTLFVAFDEADKHAEPNYQQIIFTEHSVAAFLLKCSRDECFEGGFDYKPFIDALVLSGEPLAKGQVACQGSLASGDELLCCDLKSEYRIFVRRKP